MKKNLLWLIPAILVITLAGIILALPSFVASNTHRASMEALASSLTGRDVHIAGTLSLGLFPTPQLSASRVTINGPDGETITARALTLDISLPALLHGQVRARNLTLDSPAIAFPWPLPGGAAAISPPAWLAALHAELNNGDVSLGAAHFTHVDADLFTGADGAVTVSGTGSLLGRNVNLSLALGATALTGQAPLSLDASAGANALHFSGTLDPRGTVAGTLNLAGTALTGTANVRADGTALSASALQLSLAKASMTGTAAFNFAHPAITADLIVQNLDLGALPAALPPLPVSLTLNATGVTYAGQTLPALHASLDAGPDGVNVHSAQLTLPAGATLNTGFTYAASGALNGQASLASPDLSGLLTRYGLSAPPGFASASLAARLSGTATQLSLSEISGHLGASSVTGNLVLTAGHAAGALDFDRLDMLPILAWLGHEGTGGFTADGQITAAHASFGTIPLTHLLLDGALGGGLNLRRVSAKLFGGLAAGSVTFGPGGQVTAARGFIALPSATPLAALLPAGWQPPAAVSAPRLNAAIFAQQGSAALATSLVATLGDFSLTAAPFINLGNESASGAVSLRHPDAIAAFKIFGLKAGLDWPGPGSIALRASFMASPTALGLPDFVLSLGNLTASGRILRNNGVISGNLDAGVLAIPPIPPDLAFPAALLAEAKGSMNLAADRVMVDGNTILLNAQAGLTLAPNTVTLGLTHAALAGGTLSGSVTATAATPPALSATLIATGVDPAQLALPLVFPYTLSSGSVDAGAKVTATGYSPKIWGATLAGTATLSAKNGTLAGFNLAGLAKALSSKTPSADLRAAMASGTTNFAGLTLAASLAQGNVTLTAAALTGPQGTANATGSVDVFDQDLALRLALQPDVQPPITLTTAAIGSWAAPKQYPKLRPALAWKPAPKSAP